MIRYDILGPQHDRRGFCCGVESLDRYLRENALQAARKHMTVVMVAVDPHAPSRILGYYSVAMSEVSGVVLPEEYRRGRGLPTHPLGAVLLARLAVRNEIQGEKIGARLLRDALHRAHSAAEIVGSVGVIVDAIDERATGFYEHFGFVRTYDRGRLFLAMDTIAALND